MSDGPSDTQSQPAPDGGAQQGGTPDGAQGGTPAGPGDESRLPSYAQLLQKVTDLESMFENRLGDMGKQVANLKGRVKAPEGGTPPESGAVDPRAEARNEARALLDLGEVKAKLPEKARGELDEMLDSGLSVEEVAARAQFLSKHVGSGTPPPTPPRGHTGTAAPNHNGAAPWTQQGLLKLRLRDPAEYERVTSAPDFEPPRS